MTTSPRPTVLDGGLATTLEEAGSTLDDSLWSAALLTDNPSSVEAAHAAFVEAGAEVLLTASYQASFEGFAHAGKSEQESMDLFHRSVALARHSSVRLRKECLVRWIVLALDTGKQRPLTDKNHRALHFHCGVFLPLQVAGSLGPFGACLADGSEYRGQYRTWRQPQFPWDTDGSSPKTATAADSTESCGDAVPWLREFHERRARALVVGQPDLLAFETLPCIAEGVAAAQVLRKLWDETTPSDRIPGWISFTLASRESLPSGESLQEAIEAVEATMDGCPALLAVGLNCCHPHLVRPALELLGGESSPIVAPPLRDTDDAEEKNGHHSSHALAVLRQQARDGSLRYRRRWVVYPNRGEGWDAERGVWITNKGDTPDLEEWRELVARWIEAGAIAVGGCCRVNPAFLGGAVSPTVQSLFPQAVTVPADDDTPI